MHKNHLAVAVVGLVAWLLPPMAVQAAQRLNIVWITAEDMSPTLGCYGDSYATTPHIDQLAEQSLRFTHAFATSPVCSPSRSCLITGVLTPTLGTHPMRSAYPIPDRIVGFPSLLRATGYYTTNNVKTDYNTAAEQRIIAESWDDNSSTAHWRNRPEGKPFFSVFNLMTSHQSRSMVWSEEQFRSEVQSRLSPDQIHDPATAPLPPYYPDTPVVRQMVARYYDCVTAMDQEVGQILQQLEEDGLADQTMVFFYSDHGSGMPRHKRALLDSGMRVPLLIRCPPGFSDLSPGNAGTTTDRLVSFVDFAPTVLRLAGVKQQPEYMQGHSFLGAAANTSRQYVYGHRDRVDEVMDKARSVRDDRYLYIRNYMPHRGYNQQSAWLDESPLQHEFYRLTDPQTMTAAQYHYAGPSRPREELYDCLQDPANLENLAESAEHHEILLRLRTAHRQWMMESRDVGLIPEIELSKIVEKHGPAYDWVRSPQANFDDALANQLLDAADLVGSQRLDQLLANLNHADPSIRYWATVGFSAAEHLPPGVADRLHQRLSDNSPAVQIEAANALARHGHLSTALPKLVEVLRHDDLTVILYAARTIELLGEQAQAVRPAMQALFDRFEDQAGDPAWFIRFTTTGFLNRVKGAE